MIDERDVQGLRLVRSEFSRRGINVGRCDVRLMHGVLTVRGPVSALPGHQVDNLKGEVDQVARFIRQRGNAREVVLDCSYAA